MTGLENIVFLDLGGALTAVGLVLTVYQLRTKKMDIVSKCKPFWQRNLHFSFLIIGLLLTLVRVLISNKPVNYYCINLNVPLCLEIFSYILLASSPFIFLFISTSSNNLFKSSNESKDLFYSTILREVVQSDKNTVDAALEVLLDNFPDICEDAKRNSIPFNSSNEVPYAILNVILSDSKIISILTTERLDALNRVFYEIDKFQLTSALAGTGVSRIVNSLLTNKDSFLYQHLNKGGLAIISDTYELVFGSANIINNFDLFGYPTLTYQDKTSIDENGVNVFLTAIEKTMKLYFEIGGIRPKKINEGISFLNEIFKDTVWNIQSELKRDVDTRKQMKREWDILYKLAHFFGHSYPFLSHDKTLIQSVLDNESHCNESSFHSDRWVNAGVSEFIYLSYEHLSMLENEYEVYQLLNDLMYGIIYEPERKTGYCIPFEIKLWRQITKNVNERIYPAAIKPYLCIFGLQTLNNFKDSSTWINLQAEKITRLLYIDLKPLFESGETMRNKEKMQNALLPRMMKYENGTFFYMTGLGYGEFNEIPQPHKDSNSALVS